MVLLIENIIITLSFLVFSGIREYFFYVERQKLIDRVQSRDLAEYKAFEIVETREEKEPKIKEVNWL